MASGFTVQNLWTTPADEGFSFTNFSATHITALPVGECGPFLAMVLCKWDNVLGPRLDHVWRGMGDTRLQEDSVKYVVSHVLNGELLRSVTENVIDLKMFVLKENGIVCFSFIFPGRGKSGPEISSLTLIIPYTELKSFLPFVELVEERVKVMLAKLRVLQTKVSALFIFAHYRRIKCCICHMGSKITGLESGVVALPLDQGSKFRKILDLGSRIKISKNFGIRYQSSG